MVPQRVGLLDCIQPRQPQHQYYNYIHGKVYNDYELMSVLVPKRKEWENTEIVTLENFIELTGGIRFLRYH